jgi:very-short-patch-repair endonuclease
MNKNDFEIKANDVHNHKFDYSLVYYKNNKTKIEIICSKHGIFSQAPSDHLKGRGCPKCGFEKSSGLRNFIASKNFIEKANIIHNNKYDYSLTDYVRADINIKIICPKHGIFEQTPNKQLKGHGCTKCKIDKQYSTTKEFIEKAKLIHGDKYDYSHVVYVTAKRKINIICKIHGIFQQIPNDHLNNVGCPVCRQSKGEIEIIKYLNKNSIKYIPQKKFDGCIGEKKRLAFDFYLPELNKCIEFDGEQHYIAKEIWGGNKYLIKIQSYDNIKTQYCQDNNIELIRIKYNENIENKLNEYLKSNKSLSGII